MAESPHGAPGGLAGHLSAEERKLLALMRSMTPAARLASLHFAEFMAGRCPASHEVVQFPRKSASGGEGTPCCRT